MSELQAVLFDMDGTIVDTEPYWIASEYELVESYGGTWSQAHAHALVGNPLPVSGEYIRVNGPVPLSAEEIVDRLLTGVSAQVERAVPWRPGARELLAELGDAGVPCALVTMSYLRLTDLITQHLPGTFATVVSGDQVTRGKPDPEPYLTAAARLGVDPARCVAIEDSPAGVASAQAAGCVTVAVPYLVPITPAPGRVLVESLTDLDLPTLRSLVRERAA